MTTLVMKFGGTSVGSQEALRKAANIVKEQSGNWDRLVVVVSAMSGVTDLLLNSAKAALNSGEAGYSPVISELKRRHNDVIDDLLQQGDERSSLVATIDQHLEELEAFCRSIHIMGEVTPRGLDAVSSLGERINARVFSALLGQQGMRSEPVNATGLIVTDGTFQNAVPIMELTRLNVERQLVPKLDEGVISVVTGFIGATEDGTITTLGRGGSDYTSAILGDCLDASEVWTWTDVDGVMTADPRIVPDARVVPELSYNEVGELAYFGAKVLHPKTIRPIVERDIPLWVKNTFNPTYPGTRISRNPESHPGKITAITVIRNLSMVTVEGRGMLGVPGIAARTFAAVARKDASVLMISQASSDQSICFLIPSDSAIEVIQSVEEELTLELMRGDVDRVWSYDNVVIATVIGAGLRNTPGVSARVFGAMGRSQINVIAIAQGSSEYSISLVVAAEDADEAVRQIHKEAIINEIEAT